MPEYEFDQRIAWQVWVGSDDPQMSRLRQDEL